MPVIMSSDIVLNLAQMKGDGYRCWGDKDPNQFSQVVASPPQWAFIDPRERFVQPAPDDMNSLYPYDLRPIVGYKFQRPVDRFALYLAEQKAGGPTIADPTPPGLRLMIRAGCGDYQSRIWQGDFLQPTFMSPSNGSGNDNQQRGRLIEICGPMADQWEIWALSITGSGGRVAVEQLVQFRVFAMVASTCGYHFEPGPNVTQTFPAP